MKRSVLSVLVLVMILVAGCSPAATPTPQQPTAVPPTAIPATSAPTDAPPTATTAPATATTAAAANCVYGATLVSEDPLDGQQFKAGEIFKKTWTFKNSGTCVWDAANLMFTVANAPGDTMLSGGQTPAYRIDFYSNPKKTTVPVGDTVSVVLDMQAPDHAGTFTQSWQIVDANTNQSVTITYATGTSGKTVYVQIVVPGSNGDGTKPAVTVQSVELQQGAEACTADAQYNISAKITGAPNTQVTYIMDAVDGTLLNTASETITLNNKGAYDLRNSITGPYSDPGNVRFGISISVNGQAVNFDNPIICADGVYQYQQ
jgi:hypothetical protein